MKCHNCNYSLGKKECKCPCCGEIVRAYGVSKFETSRNPNYIHPNQSNPFDESSDAVTPKVIYLHEVEEPTSRGNNFGSKIIDSIFGGGGINNIFGSFFQQEREVELVENVVLDDFGRVIPAKNGDTQWVEIQQFDIDDDNTKK